MDTAPSVSPTSIPLSHSPGYRGNSQLHHSPVSIPPHPFTLYITDNFGFLKQLLSFPDGSAGKESTCNAGDPGAIPGLGGSTGEGIGYPLQLFLGFPGGSAGKESACNVGDLDLIPGLGRLPGEGKGCPVQYSGLENSMDSIDHGVAESQTERLSLFLLWDI